MQSHGGDIELLATVHEPLLGPASLEGLVKGTGQSCMCASFATLIVAIPKASRLARSAAIARLDRHRSKLGGGICLIWRRHWEKSLVAE